MASAWGLSFGKAFGNSFGRLLDATVPLAPTNTYDWAPQPSPYTSTNQTALARKRRQQEEEAIILALLGIQ
jgi:hypothetical protein